MKIQQQANRIIPTIFLILAGIIIISLTVGFINKQPPETETYIVQYGDTLDKITSEYIVKNTYGKRNFDEFKQGIIELNIDKYPSIRYGEIYAGDRLEINYWIRKEVENEQK